MDTAGGLIIGPGSQSVFVEDYKVSLPGDVILPHACCGAPGCGSHCAATTTSESPDVICGTGFAVGSPPGLPGGAEAGGDDPDSLLVEAPDIVLLSVDISSDSEVANSTLCCLEIPDCDCFTNPPSPLCLVPVPCVPIFYGGPPPELTYSLKNISNFDSPPFTVGIFRTPNLEDGFVDDHAGPFLLTDEGVEVINDMFPGGVSMIGSSMVSGAEGVGMFAGETLTNSFTIDIGDQGIFWTNAGLDASWYAVYPDIHGDAHETDERQTVNALSFTVT